MSSISSENEGVWGGMIQTTKGFAANVSGLTDYKTAWKKLSNGYRCIVGDGSDSSQGVIYRRYEAALGERISDCWGSAKKGLWKNGVLLGGGALVSGTGFALRGLEAFENKTNIVLGEVDEAASSDWVTFAGDFCKYSSQLTQNVMKGVIQSVPQVAGYAGKGLYTACEYTVSPALKGVGKGAFYAIHNYPLATAIGSSATVLAISGLFDLQGKKVTEVYDRIKTNPKPKGDGVQILTSLEPVWVKSTRKRSWTDTCSGVTKIGLALTLVTVPWFVGR